jgi:hypothetical protein
MKNLFKEYQDKYPNHSDLLVFFRMAHAEKMKDADIRKWFTKLVPKDDYPNMESTTIIRKLTKTTK